MVVTVVAIELHLPEARSLKHKRRIVNSLKDKIHSRFRVSIAETEFHDMHQRVGLGLAAVSPNLSHLEELLAAVRRLFDSRFDLVVTRWDERALETPS